MNVSSWTVFFLFQPLTTVHTTILTKRDDVEETELISLAKEKINQELGINIDELAEKIGVNDNFQDNWIIVEFNDSSATPKEIENLKVYE